MSQSRINFNVEDNLRADFDKILSVYQISEAEVLKNFMAYVVMMDNENMERAGFLGECAKQHTAYVWKKRGEMCDELGLKWPVFEQVQ